MRDTARRLSWAWSTAAATLFLALLCAAGCDRKESSSSVEQNGGGESSTASGEDAGGDSGRAKPVIGVSLMTLTNPFFKDIADTLQAAGAKRGFDVVVVSADMDPAKQKDQVQDFLLRKVSAIVLTPCDSKSVGTSVADANSAGVPVFTADVASIAEGAKVVSHVATDNYEGGKVAGRAMVELLGGKGKVAIIDHPQVESVMLRTRGFEEVLKDSDIEVVAKLPGGGARERSFAAAQDILQSHPDLDAIFAINDPSALGAVAALENAERAGEVKVIGFDGQPEARKAVKDGKMHATVLQDPKRIALVTIETVDNYMGGEDVPEQTLIPTGLYVQSDAENDPAAE